MMKNAEFANGVKTLVGKGEGVAAGQQERQSLVDAGGNTLADESFDGFDAADESVLKALRQSGQSPAGCGANVEQAAHIEGAENGKQYLHARVVVDSLMGMHGVVARGGFAVIPALGENRIFGRRGHFVFWYHTPINYIIRIRLFRAKKLLRRADTGASPKRLMRIGARTSSVI